MLKIGIVGDLSLQNPARLDRCLQAAFDASPDLVVQVGDLHPAYNVVAKYIKAHRDNFFIIPGNHDEDFDTLGQRRQWVKKTDAAFLVGLDNSKDQFSAETWDILDGITTTTPIFVFAHKPLSRIVLPDGSESGHIMGENGDKGIADAKRLSGWLKAKGVDLLVTGHYHSWTFQRTSYCNVLVEGRGGAAPNLGYTLILIQPEGWTFHPVQID
jgi:predicted phosphodiesterase